MTAPRASLPPVLVDGRLDRVREATGVAGADALVVTNLTNVRWCTGFTGSSGVLVVTPDAATLITDSRYATQAPAQIDDSGAPVDVLVATDGVAAGASILAAASRVALEADDISWAAQQQWAEALGADLVATRSMITELRSVKDDAELTRMQRAAEIVDIP